MKKLFRLLLAAVCVASLASSCNDPGTDVDKPNSGTDQESPYPDFKEGGSEGVDITVSDVTEDDFTFSMEMGVDIPAYRFDAMPLARYYNDWMEARKVEPNMTEEEWIIKRLFNNGGASGYTVNQPLDITWGDTKFNSADLIHGIDYVIITCGALLADGTGYGAINKLPVRLKYKEVVGDPRADVELVTNYQAIEYSYVMNDECSGYYQLAVTHEDLNQFIADCGGEDPDKMIRDITCCFTRNPYYEDQTSIMDFKFNANPKLKLAFLTVGLDINGTPSNTYVRKDGSVDEPPASIPAEYEVEIVNASATTLVTRWTIDEQTTRAAYHRSCTDDEWASLKTRYTDRENAIALATSGWGHNKANSAVDYFEMDLIPDKSYTLISAARNKTIDLTEVRETKFNTRPLVLDQPEKSLANVKVEIIYKDKTKATSRYTIPTGTACYFERVMEAGYKDWDSGLDITLPENKQACIDFLLGVGGNGSPRYATEDWTWTGLSPATTYHHFVIAEDDNGFIGPLFSTTFNTSENNGGPKPEVNIVSEVVKTSTGTYTWNVKYNCNTDVKRYRYCIVDDMTDASMSMEKRAQAWADIALGEAGMENLNSSTQKKTVNQYSVFVAIAVPFGKDDIQGPTAYSLFDPAMIQSAALPMKPIMVYKAADKVVKVKQLKGSEM